jgi:hypothetical protein
MPQFQQRRLTANPRDLPVYSAVVSPDGKYLGYSDPRGIHVQLLGTGEEQAMPLPAGAQAGQAYWDLVGWYPDSTRFTGFLAIPGKPPTLWSVPILGGTPQQLAEDIWEGGAFHPMGLTLPTPGFPACLASRGDLADGPARESPTDTHGCGQAGFGRPVVPGRWRMASRAPGGEQDGPLDREL